MKINSACALIQLVGLVFEIVGVFMMANAFRVAYSLIDSLKLLLSGLVRGKFARAIYRDEGIAQKEDKLATVQGLVLIGIGFIIQAVAVLVVIIVEVINST